MQDHQFTNSLINETSPYLLQHAHNSVNWYAWNDGAWNKAIAENKLVLVSVGYSSCHWCHVMEHETFEDVDAALLMNEHFICIKVDREERPDVDHVYMSAVQLMTGQGGWPLNCICLPDGKPIFGGTYFQNARWKDVLNQLTNFYKNNQSKAEEYASELTEGIRRMEQVETNENEIRFSKDDLKAIVEIWKKHFDLKKGGPDRAPKFPMPNNYEFLLHYAVAEKEESLKNYVLLTLDKMASGGIYDQIGGGFSRYSTDAEWKVPHFEKMLYDNAQLVSLYSHAFQLTEKDSYRQVVYETLEFIDREMTSDEGGFYSALDADSEGVEGKFYVWKKEEIEQLIPDATGVKALMDYFNVNEAGYWEHGNYILLRNESAEVVAARNNLALEQFNEIISQSKKILLEERSKRVRPGLDDKQLTSWNALMIKGYCHAYETFAEKKFLDAAIRNMNHILSRMKREDGGLNHCYKGGKATVNGYLEDYSFMIEALINVYEVTFDEKYLEEAFRFADYVISYFMDEQTGLFFFTSALDKELIARKKEIHDNVIPASNSSLAKGLFLLGKYFDQNKFIEISRRMLHNIKNQMPRYGSSFSNWCGLMMWNVFPFYEVAITGIDAESKRKELAKDYFSDKIIAGAQSPSSELPLLKHRFVEGKTLIYVCEDFNCRLPVTNVQEAKALLNDSTTFC
jgi:uncharacterized protein YyaL (SSP411 family)